MKKQIFILAILSIFSFSCTSIHKSMREPNVRVEMYKSDFIFSEQLSASAKSTKILGIDVERLFLKKTGDFSGAASNESLNLMGLLNQGISIIGISTMDYTSNYAIHDLLVKNPGYDVVFYPQFETRTVKPFLGIGFIMKTTEAKVTTRLAKIK